MKKLAISVAAIFATLNIFAQGTVNFANNNSSLVYDDTRIVTPGTFVKAVIGTTFSVALYWAPVNATGTQPDSSAFTPQGNSGHLGPVAGIYSIGTVSIAGIVPAGGMGWFQVKAWETAFGSTFEIASQDSAARQGVSGVMQIKTGDPTLTPPGLPASIAAIGAIHLSNIPEPAIMGLGLLGGAALLLLRRRK